MLADENAPDSSSLTVADLAGPLSPLDHPITVTLFPDTFAKSKEQVQISLRDLSEVICETSKPAKPNLPLLKLARFGELTTDKGCLRTDKNVLAITGIEADYDGEKVALKQAAEALAEAKIAALLYTSPNHTPEKPRWRVLCPVSKEPPPDQRRHLVSRLNGVLDYILAKESWKLSQSYYYGSIDGEPVCQVELIDGDYIDQRADLDAGAAENLAPTSTHTEATNFPSKTPQYGKAALEYECLAILDAEWGEQELTLNNAALKMGKQVAHGNLDLEVARQKLIAAGLKMKNQPGKAKWSETEIAKKVDHGLQDGIKKATRQKLDSSMQKAEDWADEFADGDSPKTYSEWEDPVDFLDDSDMTGSPALTEDHIPEPIAPFVFDTAERMGVDPAAVALCAIVSCASVMSDEWRIQPKVHDITWTEQPRLWGAIVGNPSIKKSPVIGACTKPIDKLETKALRQYQDELRNYKVRHAKWKKAKNDSPEPNHPVRDRYMVESLTIEALSEVLRDDLDAKHKAPASKVLVRSDELSELLGNLDRYNAGGRGGGDRGAYLRLFNGGRHSVDRIGRGSFSCPNWSACILGGIQPEPIQRVASEAADDGLLQRFLYCVPTQQGRGIDRPPDHEALEQYDELFHVLSSMTPEVGPHGHPKVVRLHPDGQRHRKAVEELVMVLTAWPDTTSRMIASLDKLPGTFARLCLTFHLIECAANPEKAHRRHRV